MSHVWENIKNINIIIWWHKYNRLGTGQGWLNILSEARKSVDLRLPNRSHLRRLLRKKVIMEDRTHTETWYIIRGYDVFQTFATLPTPETYRGGSLQRSSVEDLPQQIQNEYTPSSLFCRRDSSFPTSLHPSRMLKRPYKDFVLWAWLLGGAVPWELIPYLNRVHILPLLWLNLEDCSTVLATLSIHQ